MKYNKLSLIILFVSVMISLAFTGFFIFDNTTPKEINIAMNTSQSFLANIDTIQLEKNVLKIGGWLIQLGQDTNVVNRSVVIKNKESDKAYCLNTIMTVRQDVDKEYEDADYQNCGFIANANISNIDSGEYEILILVEDKSDECFVYNTGSYVEVNENGQTEK